MRSEVYLEDDDGRVIKVLNGKITVDDGHWRFTKTLSEWIELAIDADDRRVAAQEG